MLYSSYSCCKTESLLVFSLKFPDTRSYIRTDKSQPFTMGPQRYKVAEYSITNVYV